MTNTDEQNLRTGIRNLIKVAAKNTGDSKYYVARLIEDMACDIACDLAIEARDRGATIQAESVGK
jgi:hypothetical protein